MKKLSNLLLSAICLLMIAFVSGCSDDPEKDVDPELEVSSGPLNFTADGGTKSIEITSNTGWKVTSNQPSWCEPETNYGKGNKTVVIICSSYDGTDERPATLTIETEDGTIAKKVNVVQSGTSSPGEPYVRLDNKRVTKNPEEGYIDVIVESNVAYDVLFPDSWIKKFEDENVEEGHVYITVEANTGDERSGKVIFKQTGGEASDTLYVTQLGTGASIKIDYKNRTIESGKINVAISLVRNVEYETILPDNWITNKDASESFRIGDDYYHDVHRFEVKANTGSQREGKIVFKQKNGNVSDTVYVTQRAAINLSGKNLAKSLITINEQGNPLAEPYRDNLYFDYDSEGRVIWMQTIQDEDNYTYGIQYRFKYNGNNDIQTIEEYGEDGGIYSAIQLISISNNRIKYKQVAFDQGAVSYESDEEFEINGKKQLTKVEFSESSRTYTYYESGALEKIVATSVNYPTSTATYTYDNKNGVFSASASPAYFWLLFPDFDKNGYLYKHNAVGVDIQGEQSYSLTISYDYNSSNYPTVARVTSPGGQLRYGANYY